MKERKEKNIALNMVALFRQAGGRKNATYCTHLFDTYYTINAGRMIG